MAHVMLSPTINPLYSRPVLSEVCAVSSVAVFCSSFMSCCGIFWYPIIIIISIDILIQVAARSRSWVCGRSLAGTAGSIVPGDMAICPL